MYRLHTYGVITFSIVALAAAAQVSMADSESQFPAEQLAEVVEDALADDALESLARVNVQAANGVVTLAGDVVSLLAKERATHVATTIEGVLIVDNQLAVKPHRRKTSEQVEAAILHSLQVDTATADLKIRVQADAAGDVTLTGVVDSWTERELVERAAKAIGGVTQITNQLRIAASTTRSDEELAREIKRVLIWDAYLDGASIEVAVSNRAVMLSGTVHTAAEKSRARLLARIAGARDVMSAALEVSGGDDREEERGRSTVSHDGPSNSAVAEAVRAALSRSPRLASLDIDVDAHSGVVTLRGVVDTLKARGVAVRETYAVRGVHAVRDLMHVRAPGAAPGQEQIRARVANALANNAFVEPYTINVEVEQHGRIQLSGLVDTSFEKGVAADVAARIKGVQAVDNDLVVLDTNARWIFDP